MCNLLPRSVEVNKWGLNLSYAFNNADEECWLQNQSLPILGNVLPSQMRQSQIAPTFGRTNRLETHQKNTEK